MPLYTVHLYPICRVKVTGIEADSPQAALAIAEENVGMYDMYPESRPTTLISLPALSNPRGPVPEHVLVQNCGYADGTDGAMVDELDAEGDVIDSREFNADGEREPVPPVTPTYPVIVTIHGGCVQEVQGIPPGFTVVIHDYDCETRDADCEGFIRAEFPLPPVHA